MVPRRPMLFAIVLSIFFLFILLPGIQGRNQDPEEYMHRDESPEESVIYTEPEDIGRPNRLAVIEVQAYGTIKIELYENMTPITTGNFIDLADSGFYDGISFHRCIDDFVAQTGDPNTKNMNPYDDGSGGSDQTIPLEICENASHIDGAVGMARSSEPDSASSQFYICDGPQHGLDDWVRMESNDQHGYAVFGVVIEGLDIAKEIAAAETYGNIRPLLKDHPVDDIIMTSVIIEEQKIENITADMEDEKNAPSGETPFLSIPILLFTIITASILIRRRTMTHFFQK
ncbi:MAG: peptidylprolyl isomerase [Candidatus Thermoplasmatota archaeon]|nr:peptidylprolyl isomerase [Candidatus Thermoplasmatota archaeon]